MSKIQSNTGGAILASLVACALACRMGTAQTDDSAITLGFRTISPNRAEGFFLRPAVGEESGRAKVKYNIDNSCEYYVRYNEYFLMYTDTGAEVEAWDSNRNEPHFKHNSDGRMLTVGFSSGRDTTVFYRYATMPSVELKVLKDASGTEIGQYIERTGELTYHAIGAGATAQTEKAGLGAYLSGSAGIGLASFEDDWSDVAIPLTLEAGLQYYLPLTDTSWLMARFGYYAGGALMIGDSPCYVYAGPSFSAFFRF